MSPPNPSCRCLRFSLRSVFLLVTLVGGVLGWNLNWIQQRHHLQAKHQALVAAAGGRDSIGPYYVLPASCESAPLALRWLREPDLTELPLIVLVDRHQDRSREFGSYDEVQRARRLFPEAQIIGAVWAADEFEAEQRSSLSATVLSFNK